MARKMVIVEVGPRGKETPISWASTDHWAMVTAMKIAPDTKNELYWRYGSPSEIKALETQRAGGKLPGW